jgi:hypothetical protein
MSKKNKLKKAKKFYKAKSKQHKIIRNNIKRRGHIVYGARALNAHLPSYLDKHTEDWDVYSKTPKKTAKRVERKLDKAYGGDYYYTEPAMHPGTHKVKSKITRTGVADYTKMPASKIPTKTIGGIKYITLAHSKKMINRALRNPEAKFRRDKDLEAKQRIAVHEETPKRRKRKPLVDSRRFLGGAFG